MSNWYVAVNGQSQGPFSRAQIIAGLNSGQYTPATMIWRDGFADWLPLSQVDALNDPTPTNNVVPPPAGSHAHEIDYAIFGHEMQFVEIELDQAESVVSEAGAMMYMSDRIQLETIFGDGSAASQRGGFLDKMLGAGKRLISGEGLFITMFTYVGKDKGKIAFASPYPGKIIPLDLKKYNNRIICQKDAFLCAARGVSIGIAFQKKIGTALFGGEGFIMQQLDGDGYCFVHAGGTIIERELAAGEHLKVDTGCLVALTRTVNYDIEFVGNVKSALFGGEGFFFATLEGPGHVWLQSLPFSRLAGRIWKAAPQAGGQSVGEGSLLGGIATMFER
ncbi:MAG: TIGR00266 family protein [Desulfocapsa sp.]|nr:MAG: TIGR00266 family protein [Desulfocapsa sp.]